MVVQLDLLTVAPQGIAGGGVESNCLGVGRRRVGGVGAQSRVDGGQQRGVDRGGQIAVGVGEDGEELVRAEDRRHLLGVEHAASPWESD